jgi:glycosyltransferase involved in cell wall biosynthesis
MSELNKIIVSVIMPTFNRERWIGKAIESVIKQNYKMWELIIVNNESTDNTEEVVKSYLYDKRIKYFYVKKEGNSGISDYLNFGIEHSQGEFIARLDDDDEWYDPDKLIKQTNFLQKNNDYVVVGGGAIMVDEKKNELFRFYKRETDTQIRNNALYANPFCHNTVLFRKADAQKIGGYYNIKFAEDWDFWLRLGNLGKFYNFQEYFLLYTNAGQNRSTENQRLTAKIILQFIKQYKNDYPNYWKALLLNFAQYVYSFCPQFIKNKTQVFLFYIKRNYF